MKNKKTRSEMKNKKKKHAGEHKWRRSIKERRE